MVASLARIAVALAPWVVAAMVVSATYDEGSSPEAEKIEQDLRTRASPPPPPASREPKDDEIEPWEIVPV